MGMLIVKFHTIFFFSDPMNNTTDPANPEMGPHFQINFVGNYVVPGVNNVRHMSFDKPDRIWVSDSFGNTVLIDPNDGTQAEAHFPGQRFGFHTVTMNGDLLYIDRNGKFIRKISLDNAENGDFDEAPIFINTGQLRTACSIYSSRNEDILVGMVNGEIVRYDKNGLEKISMNLEDNIVPRYITENAKGDVYVSCFSVVVVVNKSLTRVLCHYEEWSWQQFSPFGICAYDNFKIFVCNPEKNTMRNLTHRKQYIISEPQFDPTQFNVQNPSGLCLDDERNIHVGNYDTNIVSVFSLTHIEDNINQNP